MGLVGDHLALNMDGSDPRLEHGVRRAGQEQHPDHRAPQRPTLGAGLRGMHCGWARL